MSRDRFVHTHGPPKKHIDSYRKADLVNYAWNNKSVGRDNLRASRQARTWHAGGQRMEVLEDRGFDAGDETEPGNDAEVLDDVGIVKPDSPRAPREGQLHENEAKADLPVHGVHHQVGDTPCH